MGLDVHAYSDVAVEPVPPEYQATRVEDEHVMHIANIGINAATAAVAFGGVLDEARGTVTMPARFEQQAEDYTEWLEATMEREDVAYIDREAGCVFVRTDKTKNFHAYMSYSGAFEVIKKVSMLCGGRSLPASVDDTFGTDKCLLFFQAFAEAAPALVRGECDDAERRFSGLFALAAQGRAAEWFALEQDPVPEDSDDSSVSRLWGLGRAFMHGSRGGVVVFT